MIYIYFLIGVDIGVSIGTIIGLCQAIQVLKEFRKELKDIISEGEKEKHDEH